MVVLVVAIVQVLLRIVLIQPQSQEVALKQQVELELSITIGIRQILMIWLVVLVLLAQVAQAVLVVVEAVEATMEEVVVVMMEAEEDLAGPSLVQRL